MKTKTAIKPKIRQDYTPIPEWMLWDKGLTKLIDIFLVARLKRFKKKGCIESNAKLAKLLRTHPRYIQKRIAHLEKTGYIARVAVRNPQDRYLYPDPETTELPPEVAMPLFDKLTTMLAEKMSTQ